MGCMRSIWRFEDLWKRYTLFPSPPNPDLKGDEKEEWGSDWVNQVEQYCEMGKGRIGKWRDWCPPHLRSLPTLQPCLRLCLWMWFSECGSVRRRRTVSLDVCVGVYYWCWLILLHRRECCFWLLSVRSASFRFVPRWLWLQSFVHVPTFVRCPLILSCFSVG